MFPMPKMRRLVRRLLRQVSPDRFSPYTVQIEFPPHTFQFWIADETGKEWYGNLQHWHECAEPRELLNLIKPGDRVLEIGCHHGLYTALMARAVGPTGLVVGLEAHPRNALVAQAQVALNRLGSTCHVCHRAASNMAGRATFTDVSNAQVRLRHQWRDEVITVDAVTGDALLEEHGSFNVLKLDVEGFEGKVLEGCTRLLAARPKIALELHVREMRAYGATPQEIYQLLDINQYEGTMMLRDYLTVLPFRPNDLPDAEIVNLFLRPKGTARSQSSNLRAALAE